MAKHGFIDSKYRFIILAAKRARQLYGGARPMVASSGKQPVRIAQEEVAAGLVDYELLADGLTNSTKRPNQTRRRQKKRISEVLAARIAS